MDVNMLRRSPLRLLVSLSFMLVATPPGFTQTVADAPSSEAAVEVVGVRDPDWKPYTTMLLGFDAYAKHRALAPAAELKFRLQPQSPGVSLGGLTLQVANREHAYPVAVAADGTFALARIDALLTPDAQIVINRKKNAVRWRPHIVSPNMPAGHRRLGDLRLECEVRWAIEKSDFSFLKRNLIDALGGPCKTNKARTHYFADRPLATVSIREGNRVMPVPANTQAAWYIPPIFDSSWSDDALIELHFVDNGHGGSQ